MFEEGDMLIHKSGGSYYYLHGRCKVKHPRNNKLEDGFCGIIITKNGCNTTTFGSSVKWLEKYCIKLVSEQFNSKTH